MKLSLTWHSSPQRSDFLPQPTDIRVVPLEVQLLQKENTFPRAILILTRDDAPLSLEAMWGVILGESVVGDSAQGFPRIMFQGQSVCVTPHEGGGVQVELVARPLDADAQKSELLEDFRTHPLCQPLLLSPHQVNNPDALGFFQPVVVDWDPCTLRVSLRHLCTPSVQGVVDLTPYVDPERMRVQTLTPPPREVRVSVCAQWVQRTGGFMNLAPAIADMFPQGVIQTYTPQAFKAAWPRKGEALGKSGYWVAASRLQQLPTSSAGESPSTPAKVTFKATLVVGWEVQQKREETLSFVVKSGLTLPEAGLGPPEEIFLTLRSVMDPETVPVWTPHMVYDEGDQVRQAGCVYRCTTSHRSRESFEDDGALWDNILDQERSLPLDQVGSSFFLTPQGQRVADAAVEIAHTHLVRLQLHQELHVFLPASHAQDLKVGSRVRVQDPRLMAQAQEGRVKEIITTFCGQKGAADSWGSDSCQLILSLTPPGSVWPAAPCESSGLPSSLRATPSGFRYHTYDGQVPDDETHSPTQGRGPGITHLSLINGPQVQELALKSAPLVSGGIQDNPEDRGGELGLGTRLILRLSKLQPRETLSHTITLKLYE